MRLWQSKQNTTQLMQAITLPSESAGKKVLVVDDHMAIWQMLRAALTHQGWSCVHEINIESAETRLAHETFDFFLLDVNLPDGSGMDLLHRLRQHYAVTNPIIMMSGMKQPIMVKQALDLGADDYVTKPFPLAEMLMRIEQLSEKSACGGAPATTSTAISSSAS
jgi:DNA-binding response OmpR family regulator